MLNTKTWAATISGSENSRPTSNTNDFDGVTGYYLQAVLRLDVCIEVGVAHLQEVVHSRFRSPTIV